MSEKAFGAHYVQPYFQYTIMNQTGKPTKSEQASSEVQKKARFCGRAKKLTIYQVGVSGPSPRVKLYRLIH